MQNQLSRIKKNDFWTYVESNGKIIGYYVLMGYTTDGPAEYPWFVESSLIPTCGFAYSPQFAEQMLLDFASMYFEHCIQQLGDQNP